MEDSDLIEENGEYHIKINKIMIYKGNGKFVDYLTIDKKALNIIKKGFIVYNERLENGKKKQQG
tara:strand:+ start:99 stop:290 length:192 start_codon:yes stop_codon:yes gene_type:complete